MAEQKKKTQAEILTEILSLALTDEQKELVEKIIASKTKKATEKKPTKEQKEALAEADALYTAMESDKWYTVSELMKLIGLDSCQKITNRVVALKDKGMVENTKQKGKSVYRKIAVATEDEAEG